MKKYNVLGFVHSGITVKNLKISLEFYTNILGLKKIHEQKNDTDYIYKIVEIPGLKAIKVAFLKIPDGNIIELLEYDVDKTSGATSSSNYGTGHICLQVKNLNNMFVELKNKGVEFISKEVVLITEGHNKGAKAVYMKDPDGYIIELMEKNKSV